MLRRHSLAAAIGTLSTDHLGPSALDGTLVPAVPCKDRRLAIAPQSACAGRAAAEGGAGTMLEAVAAATVAKSR